MEKLSPEDAVIIARIRRNDADAFNDLVRRHQHRAYQCAHNLTKNPEEAADIVAEAFVRVFRSILNFNGECSFTTWLYRIVTNCFLDMHKKSKSKPTVSLRDVIHVQDGEVESFIMDERETAHELVERGERLSTILAAIKCLPKHHQTILMMYHADSMSYETIAATLDLPIGTVKSRINRARLSLHGMLRQRKDLFVLPKQYRPALQFN